MKIMQLYKSDDVINKKNAYSMETRPYGVTTVVIHEF
jgi:hypothetical protein